ncbi:uncharacterized protein N7484_004945 [Penicillium longicatenatum]|uniref:uncharacterized protein n=1 Tax=Penicillium longicatenatum TaxID=1561947 RepID=UPI0025474FF1|nr:uncharacterized protein N7484_004945 [Penicillium longicatenatum]KAJ5651222.1 hypothetical protein N7484_004945 [Penicillium longicatenatum]
MTDTSSFAITHATTDSYPVPAPPDSPVNGAISDSGAPDEEEPYTIKCICQFNEDDGSTVFCERCETWQHIVCYYPDKRVPDVHNCIECEPRQLDSRRAADRQRQRRIREQSEDGDRRKRSSAKATKKKLKDGDMNGFGHQRSESGARDQPPAKKTKTSHRPSTSISALSGTPHLPAQSRKRRSSTSVAPSPTKLSGPSIPLYSNEFLQLYDGDEDHVDMDSNLFVNVSLVGESASWVKNPDALARVTNGRRAEDTFIRSDAALDRSRWPALTTDTITDSNIEISGRHPTWKIVKTQDAVRKDEVVGEITGKVGIFDDYCLDSNNRWSELRHPEPFVFFSSHLPLYIDSRCEGSMLRYTRRSCRPNVTMKIFITNDVEYHFCFVAKEDIPAGSEITIMWYLDAQLSESSNGFVKQESGDSATDAAAMCISNTLANFGGCACEHPQNCLLANIDRRRHPKSLETPKQTNGKRKKANTKPGKSPLDAQRGSTSRAGSETTKHTEDDDAAVDSRSTSGSVRKSLSRDISPTASNPGLAGLGMSSRERRKIADAEKQFQALENDQRTTAQKKKKRTSAPSAQSPVANPPPSHTTSRSSFFASQRASNKMLPNNNKSNAQSESPNTGLSPGSLPAAPNATSRGTSGSIPPHLRQYRHNYMDAGIQCDRDNDPPPYPPREKWVELGIVPGKNWVNPKIALLERYFADCRRHREKSAREQLSSAGSDSVNPGESVSPFTQSPNAAMAADMDMDTAQTADIMPSAIAGNLEANKPDHDSRKSPTFAPWPSIIAHTTRLLGSITSPNQGNLRVSMPPPSVPGIPLAISPGSASNASLASPSTVEASSPHSAQIPAAPTPTPAKRKLTLGDYLSRRGTLTTPTSESSQAQAPTAAPTLNPLVTPGPEHAVSADDAQNPSNPSADNNASGTKVETSQPSDVTMKDAPDSAEPHHPSIAQ